MKTIFVTGVNRGIGAALCECLLERGYRVIGTTRSSNLPERLGSLQQSYPDRLQLYKLEAASDDDIAQLAQKIESAGMAVDVLINNAGMATQDTASIGRINRSSMNFVFEINATSPLILAQALLPALKRSAAPLVINISSILGSIGSTTGMGGWHNYGYNASKAALNMISKMMAIELKPQGVGVLVVHPGWVQTDMGGKEAPMPPRESAERIIGHMEGFDMAQTGNYLDPDGKVLPW